MTGYRYHSVFGTRWNDNDQYAHVNNVVYYEAMDTTINTWLISAGLVPAGGRQIAVCVCSACDYHAPISFPDAMWVGLRAARLGSTSVTWELAIHRLPGSSAAEPGRWAGSGTTEPETAEPAATGRFVHVFVDAQNRRPVPIEPELRAAIESTLLV